LLTASADETEAVNCAGGDDGVATVTAQGGTATYTYSDSEFGTYTTNNVFSGLAAGDYTFWVKDANGCTATATVTITCSLWNTTLQLFMECRYT